MPLPNFKFLKYNAKPSAKREAFLFCDVELVEIKVVLDLSNYKTY